MVNDYGNRLGQALELAKRERQELADAIGVSVQAIGQVIGGKTKALTAENSAHAAKFLGVSLFWLATGKGAPMQNDEGPVWPFSTPYALYQVLPDDEKKRIDHTVKVSINYWHEQNPMKSKKSA
jgi:antitoxin HigA-1